MVDKSVLRKVYLEKRRMLSDDEYDRRCRNICNSFIQSFPPADYNSLHIFLPIIENREVNTWLIIHEARKINPQLQIYISRTLPEGRLEHFLLEEDTKLKVSAWGIPEPDGYQPVSLTSLDIILVPLIVSDKSGHRLGYGKGYYDRFLHEVDCGRRVGLTLSPSLDSIQYTEDHDVALTSCIGPFLTEHFS